MARIVKIVSGIAVAVALVAGAAALFQPAQAVGGGCLCPKIYAPVKCSNGKTYPNQCVANCHNAKNCVPTGDI